MEKAKKKISKRMTFAEILRGNPEAAEIFMKKGMTCVGCPMAMQETLEEGANAHGIKLDDLIKELNKTQNKRKDKIRNNN